MSSFTLDDIREAAEKKYGSLDITLRDGSEVVLRNPLRLSKAERKELNEIHEAYGSDDEESDGEDADNDLDEQEEFMDSVIRLVAARGKGDALIEEIGDRMDVKIELFNRYTNGGEMGEASASAS